ncbi:desmoplakin-A isoform X3 [Trichomycterus rosablanca]|uniref:desmoplakin-A isoform X3 n=1 Tax=Trichomycterus rosablanca TaxID=2290929 RepID=UPI002F356397
MSRSSMRNEQLYMSGNGFQPELSAEHYSRGPGVYSGNSYTLTHGGNYSMKGQQAPEMMYSGVNQDTQYSRTVRGVQTPDPYLIQTGTLNRNQSMMGQDMPESYLIQSGTITRNQSMMGQDMPDPYLIQTGTISRNQSMMGQQTMGGTMVGGTSRRGRTSTSKEESRSFQDAMGWINQQKSLIETSQFGEDANSIEQQIQKHNQFHNKLQRSAEVERAKSELMQQGDKSGLNYLEKEWDSLQKMSHTRTNQLQELQNILGEICGSIMWVNDKEEKELVFDWGDKNIDTYIPQKQESYSILMRELEKKEKELNKLKSKVDQLLVNHHPASDKIEAYMDTLQTQWSWLLQITKCIDVHLKENAAYSQFFKEAGEMHQRLDKDKQSILKNYSCDKTTPLQNLTELLRNLEKERDRLMENKRQVQTLVNKSKNIVQLKPRNPEERSTGQPVMVRALCDFKQDQKVICKGDEAILNDNSQRSKWNVTGPGGLDMLIPSVCLIIPPPNKYCTELAKKNEDHYEAIMSIWSQMLINIKSLIAWQYCLSDINKIKSITMEMLVQMKPEEYKSIVRSLEQHYEEFLRLSGESSVFKDADKRKMEEDFNTAQKRIKNNQVQGNYTNQVQGNYTNQVQGNYTLLTQVVGGAGGAGVAGAGVAVTGAGGETLGASGKKVDNTTITSKSSSSTITSSSAPPSSSVSLNLLTLTQTLRRRLEAAEGGLSTHLHVPLRDNSVQDCTQRLQLLQGVHRDLGSIRDEYIRLRELVLKQQATASPEQANFLKMELDHINQKLGSLESFSSSYLERLKALQAFFQSLSRAEDIIKVHEARLTEKETSSLDPSELQDYAITLKNMKADLDQRKDVLKAMEAELKKAIEWNSQIDQNFHQCDVDLDKFSVEVKQMSLRWERILGQINSRMNDLRSHEDQLRQYQQSSSQVDQWINQTSQRLNKLQNQKLRTVQEVTDHLNQHKTLHTEIKGKKDRVDEVQKDAGTCSSSIKDYELQLASYSAGLETLLNIPIKRTMLQSPATVLNQEVSDLQTRYMELLTRSTDYNKFLSEMMKNMEELKMQNTRIELLEEELRRLKDDLQDGSQNSKSKEDILACYKLELSQAKEKLIIIESEKSDESRRYLLTKESLDGTQNKLKDLSDQVARLTMLIDEEKRKRRLAEERYGVQQQEYEDAVRKRQKELDELNWSRIDFEKTIKDKEREIEQLKRQLQDEASQRRAAESETSKSTLIIQESQTHYKEVLHERDNLLAKLKMLEMNKDKQQRSEEELNRIKLSLDSELRQKQRLQEEIDKLRKDFTYWKSQYELKEGQMRQWQSTQDQADRDRGSLQNEIARLAAELRSAEERYRIRLQNSETEMVELNRRKETLERELKKLQLRPSATVKQTQTDQEVVAVDSSQFSVQGIRNKVSLDELLQCNMINQTDVDKVKQGQLSVKDIETRLKRYLTGSNCIAGVYDEAHDRVLPFYQAMKEGLLRPGTTLELLEAQAASGFMIDPVNNNYMTVEDAWKRTLVGKEFKDKLLSAERAVTGYRDPGTGKLISLFQAIEKELIEKGHGIRLLEAQIASGGIIDPKESHRIDVEMAYKKGYFNRDMNDILTYEGDDTKGFFDPNTHENLTYLELQKRCIKDPNTGLTLLPIKDKTQSSQQSTQKNTLRKRRVVIVDPDTGKEMSVREAYHRELIDYDTFLNLSEQECEWEEITITDPSGKTRLVIVDRKTGTQFDVQASLDKGVISKSALDQYRAGTLSLTQFANLITSKADSSELSICTSVADDVTSCSSPTDVTPSSPTVRKRFASVSITLSPPADILDDQSPVAAIFDTETLEKITITEAQRRGIVDTITAQRLLEAQVCTGGVINPATGKRLSLQDAIHQSVIEEDMATKLKPAQKAFAGFEDIKTRRKLSAAEAIKEKWLPYEAGQRFLEFQYLTGGLMEPGSGKRVTIEEAIRRGWLDGKGAQKLQDTRNYIKSLTCPKTKLKISYKEAMDNCMVEENNGMKMLQATSMSTKGISSPYNVSSGPNSRTGSRAGSRSGSRRGSVDYSSTATYSYTSSSFSPY